MKKMYPNCYTDSNTESYSIGDAPSGLLNKKLNNFCVYYAFAMKFLGLM